MPSIMTVAPVHEQVHERAGEQEQIRQRQEDVPRMGREQVGAERRQGERDQAGPAGSR